MDDIKKIVVIGTGFIGLPLALQLANSGKTVIGVDIDENLVKAINDQSLNLDEDRLQQLLENDRVQANLIAQTDVESGDAFVISVPTPLTEPQKSPDLSAVEAAIDSIIPHLNGGEIINIESTIPPLTTDDVIQPRLDEAGFTPGQNIYLTHSPERILPGNVFEEIVHNDRVIGGVTPEGARSAATIYEPFLEGDIYFTSSLSAELCKLMENTFRDINIAIANEFALIGDELGIDITEVMELANHHPRVDILSPGIGVGGHCLPIDPWFLNEIDPEHTNLITTARRINDTMPRIVCQKLRKAVSDLNEPKILVFGAAYKPNTHDLRGSPAIDIVEELRNDGYDIEHYDRHVETMAYDNLISLLERKEPDAVILLVPHAETVAEIEDYEDTLERNRIRILRVGSGNPLCSYNE